VALAASLRKIPTGSASPRLSPPVPVKTIAAEYAAEAKGAAIDLMPWQSYASKFMMARDGDRFRYREVAFVVARQNGKTEMLIPRILWGLKHGRRMLHTAQNRSLPRQVLIRLSRVVDPNDVEVIRYANGTEEILFKNGGHYQIVAPQRGARGLSADDLIIDELREFEDFDFIGAATPTLSASKDPQIIYLSNAGHDGSVVLNQLRDSTDDRLAYLEWSADPEFDAGDVEGWAQANPALGYLPGMYDNLQHAYANRPSALFETEHLCRWVASMSPALVTDIAWRSNQVPALGQTIRPSIAVAMDPAGKRASAALAWQTPEGVAYRPLLEVSDPVAIDVDAFGVQVRAEAKHYRVRGNGYSAISDAAVARYLTKPTAIDGRVFANASAHFATLVENHRLLWSEAEALTDDLRYTIRKDQQAGAWSAVRSEDSRPITAALAAIRAVWIADAPRPAAPRIG
jgi:hypothetical protein